MEAVRPVEREIWREEDSRPPIHHPKPREDWTGGMERQLAAEPDFTILSDVVTLYVYIVNGTGGKGPRPVVFRWELKRLWEHASSLLDHPLHDYYSEPELGLLSPELHKDILFDILHMGTELASVANARQ
eukprot:1395268-Amorphochlora_amoeboformis.AAC.2